REGAATSKPCVAAAFDDDPDCAGLQSAGWYCDCLPDGEPRHRAAEHRRDRKHYGTAVARHYSAGASILRRSGRNPHYGATQYRDSDAAEVAVCRGFPVAAHFASAIDCRASAEVHCADKRDTI